jgi:hypothetical protein
LGSRIPEQSFTPAERIEVAIRDHVKVIDEREGLRLLDEASRQYLHMSADEFLRRWDAGEFADKDTPEITRVSMLISAARQ